MKSAPWLMPFFVLAACILTSAAFAQEMQDVVYLKNGSIIRGLVIEQVPGKSLKIRTRDGSVFGYSMEEVERITKETPVEPQGMPSSGGFGISGHVGTDISGGLGFGGGVFYVLIPGGGSSGYEFALDYFFHEYDEQESDVKNYTDLNIFALRANWLWNYQRGQSGVYFVTGVGFVFATLDYSIEYNPAVYGYSLTESYDYSSVGNIINLGVGWTSASGFGLRFETPMLLFYDSGQSSSFVPTFTLAAQFVF